MAMDKSKYICFFDESGDHSLEPIDKDFPLFILSLVIVERKDYINTIIPEIGRFKVKYWNHEGINLHSSDIRKTRGDFLILFNRALRDKFYSDLNILMADLPYKIMISAIMKDKLKMKYTDNPDNPYSLALTSALESLFEFLELQGEEFLPCVAEARGRNEDHELERVFYKIIQDGFPRNTASRFKKIESTISFRNKRENIAGIQLADLAAYPCGRHIIKPDQENRSFDIVKQHFLYFGDYKGFTMFP